MLDSTASANAGNMSRLRVILGTMEIGRRALTADQPCFDLLNVYLNREGYRELDTALMYTNGASEQIIGRYLAANKERRVVLATKANPWKTGLTRESVLQQASLSLANLQLPSVDVFYLHAPDHNTPIEETLAACQQLYEEGKFKELGLSNYAAWEVADIVQTCRRNGWVAPTVYQGMYNPITRMVEDELFPALRHYGIRFYAYNPLAGGMLSGKYAREDLDKQPSGRFWGATAERWASAYRDRFWRESVFEGADLVRRALDEAYGAGKVSLPSAAFRWLNHHSAMKPECDDAIILGVSSREHLVANVRSCEEGPLDERVVGAFDAAWRLDKANCAKYFR